MKTTAVILFLALITSASAMSQSLSEEQNTRLKNLNTELELSTEQLFTIGQLLQHEEQTEKQLKAKIAELQNDLEESKKAVKARIEAILTDEQAAKYRQLEEPEQVPSTE